MSTADMFHVGLVFFGLIATVVGSLITYALSNGKKHSEHRVRFAKLEGTRDKITDMQKEIQSLREALIAHGVSINN